MTRSGPPTWSSPWAAVTPAPFTPASATRTGTSPTRPARRRRPLDPRRHSGPRPGARQRADRLRLTPLRSGGASPERSAPTSAPTSARGSPPGPAPDAGSAVPPAAVPSAPAAPGGSASVPVGCPSAPAAASPAAVAATTVVPPAAVLAAATVVPPAAVLVAARSGVLLGRPLPRRWVYQNHTPPATVP